MTSEASGRLNWGIDDEDLKNSTETQTFLGRGAKKREAGGEKKMKGPGIRKLNLNEGLRNRLKE